MPPLMHTAPPKANASTLHPQPTQSQVGRKLTRPAERDILLLLYVPKGLRRPLDPHGRLWQQSRRTQTQRHHNRHRAGPVLPVPSGILGERSLLPHDCLYRPARVQYLALNSEDATPQARLYRQASNRVVLRVILRNGYSGHRCTLMGIGRDVLCCVRYQ